MSLKLTLINLQSFYRKCRKYIVKQLVKIKTELNLGVKSKKTSKRHVGLGFENGIINLLAPII